MRDTTRLDWRVPTDAYERFVEYVQDEFGQKDGYLGREAEAAMREFADLDGYNEIEEKLNRLVQAAGRTVGDLRKEKNNLADRDYSTERTRVTARVETSVKEAFAAHADANNHPYGYEIARAFDRYLDYDRRDRMNEKLDRVLDDAEAILSELNESEDSAEDGLPAVKRRTIAIANDLGPNFTDDELVATIEDHGHESDPTIRKYRERVADHKGVEPHPANPEMWIRSERAEEIRPDGVPAFMMSPSDYLARDEKNKRLEVAAGAEAYRHDGKIRITLGDIRRQVFNNDVSQKTVNNVVDDIANLSGFEAETSGGDRAVKVKLEEIAENRPSLFSRIQDYYDSDLECLLEGAADTTFDQYIETKFETDAEGNAQTAMTDGGNND